MKIVRASDHSLAAGRDIVINLDEITDARIRSVVEKALAQYIGRPIPRIARNNKNSLKIEDMEEYTNRISALTFVQSADNRSKFHDYAVEHLQQSRTDNTVGRLFNGVDQALRKKEFKRAHSLLGKLLNIDWPKEKRDDIIENYLVSGYISNANSGNTSGMLALIKEAQQRFFGSVDEGIEYLLIEVQQEIATRQDDNALLQDNERLLLDFLRRHQIAPEESGLLGLLYRRMGERGSVEHLHKAEDIFQSILEKRKGLTVEESNSFGITLIRNYELTKDNAKLDKALAVLKAIDFKKEEHPLTDYLSLPKAKNNIGNAYKQKLKFTRNPDFYIQAIESYVEAERYWNETTAPYEWAMLQKNKAEVRVEYYKVSGNSDVLLVATDEITASLKYRTEEQSPYQYAKSMAVKEKIDAALQNAGGQH